MGANGVPGVAIGVAYRDSGGPLQQEYFHYGVASRQTGRPMDESSIVLVNSITKVFTSALLAMNIQRGVMSAQDPIQRYLTDATVPTLDGAEITLEHLATHRSGLPRDIPNQTQDKTGAGLIKYLSGYALPRPPGAQYEYSNFAFALLGLILSRSMGAPYADLVANEITGPLGMPDTLMLLSDEQKTRQAQGTTTEGAAFPLRPISSFAPAGDLLSTTPDQMRFLMAHMDPDSTPLGPSLAPGLKLYARVNNNRSSGLGWEIDFPGTVNEAFWKDGGDRGATSQTWFARGLNYGYVILTNRGLSIQNGLPVPGSSPAGNIATELRRILTAAARA
jgi:CubicO group peptidase (beta-lactamase class C family)